MKQLICKNEIIENTCALLVAVLAAMKHFLMDICYPNALFHGLFMPLHKSHSEPQMYGNLYAQ